MDTAADANHIVETHISRLFFTPDRVFKTLKPVSLPFFDATESAKRIDLVDRELELNRRFAPDVYLGHADVVEHDELVDRMLVMRRLPDDRRLSGLVGTPGFDDCLRSIARRIAAIHAASPPVDPAPMATCERVAENWADNFAAIEPHVGSLIDHRSFERVHDLATAYLRRRDALFADRIHRAFVRDGHGDLTADDIFCLADGPRLLDCLAFDDDLRIGDVLADIGFLAMDVHRLAGRSAARTLIHAYGEFSNEHHPSSLAHFYVAYRAHVRAKVACFRSGQGDLRSAEMARTYHDLAEHHLERSRVRMILVGGGAGVGKSTIAAGLADHYGYVHLATDSIRHDVVQSSHDHHERVEPGTGIYAPEVVDETYAEQRRQARLLLDAGHGIILDASWGRRDHREAARCLADECGANLVEMECRLDADTARDRIARRIAAGSSDSDAAPEVVDYLAGRHEDWPTATRVSTAGSTDESLSRAVRAVERSD